MNRLTVTALVGLASACSPDHRSDYTDRIRSPVELSGLDGVFGLAVSLSDVAGADARSREVASLATGGLRVKLNDSSGAPWMTPEGARVGASCGATFIAPSFAVTAAHCVDGNDTDEESIVVEMYRPTLALSEGFRAATILRGNFPAYDHDRLTDADGYYTDRYPCQIVSRCGDSFIPIACDPSVSTDADTALLECAGKPGEKYGYVSVAAADDMGAEIFMPWKHEVYDVDASPAADLATRYVILPGSNLPDNYHYLSVSSTGIENHQLLPLISVPYSPGTPHQKLSSSATGVTTDLLGCHGTSGSGIMQRGAGGLWELLGPARYGERELNELLCNHIPALVGPEHVAGGTGIGYTPLSATQHVAAQLEASIAQDCNALPDGATTLLTHLPCMRQNLAAQPEDAEFAGRLATPAVDSPLDPLGSWVLTVPESTPIGLARFRVTAGESYRFGLEGSVAGGCAAEGCPALVVSAEGQELLRSASFDSAGANTAVSASFTAATDTLNLTFEVRGGALELGALSLVPVDHLLNFDRAFERLLAVLVDTTAANAAPSLMRFVGDGVDGFEARLLPSERMLLPHLALVAGLEAAASFATRGSATLTCGLLGPDLAPASTFDCTGGTVALPPFEGTGSPRGFYIENTSSSDAALVDDVRVVTYESVDSDSDGLADSVDDCPMGSVPKQAALERLNQDLEQEVCVPAPTWAPIPLPDISALAGCELEIGGAALVAAQGRELDEPLALDLDPPVVELGPGVHTVTWTLRTLNGSEELSFRQSLSIVHGVTAACCSDDLSVWEGGPADDSHYATTALCALTAGGSDVVRGSPAADWIWGGPGSDFLSGELGDDVVLGGDGDDVLSGGSDGHVTIYAGTGNDTIQLARSRSSLVFAGEGSDTVVGSRGDDVVYPGPGASTTLTGAGDDTAVLLDQCELTPGMVLDGGEGEDVLHSPVSGAELEAAGVTVSGFETIVVNTSRAYLAECFGSGQ